jgi:hypothetical protein
MGTAVSTVVKQQGCETDHSLPSNAEVMNDGVIPPLSHTPSWRGSQTVDHGENFCLVCNKIYFSCNKLASEPMTRTNWKKCNSELKYNMSFPVIIANEMDVTAYCKLVTKLHYSHLALHSLGWLVTNICFTTNKSCA